MSAEGSTEVVKYYTRARKFPQLLGKLPDGTRIPGGPYTIHQLLAGVAMLFIAAKSMGVWGIFGTIGNLITLAGLVYGTIFFVGRMPTNGRNPLIILTGLMRVTIAPRTGRFQGRPIHFRRPRGVTHKVNVFYGPLPEVVAVKSLPVSVGTPAQVRCRSGSGHVSGQLDGRLAGVGLTSSRHAPLTSVQALLASADRHEEMKAVR